MAKISDDDLQEIIDSIVEKEDEGESALDVLKEFLKKNYKELSDDEKKKVAGGKAQATGSEGMQGMF